MNLTSISNQAALSRMMAAQQVSAPPDDSEDDAFEGAVSGTASGTSGNSLTGSATGTLDNQTLQALLSLTQTDPSDEEDAASQTSAGQTQTANAQTSQTQGPQVHHHRHHHGGGMSSTSSSATDSTTDDSGTGIPAPADNGDASDDLAAAIG